MSCNLLATGHRRCDRQQQLGAAGSRTGTGQPVLCGDPHQPFWVPSSWYEYALHGPEDDAAGAGHPGFPGMWWGSNGTTAWGITNNAASTRDLYVRDGRSERPGPLPRRRHLAQIRANARWKSRSAAKPPAPASSARPSRGPIVNALITHASPRAATRRCRCAGSAPSTSTTCAPASPSRARRTGRGFRDALRDWSIAVFNFVYADSAGHIGYQMAGRVPVRGRVVARLSRRRRSGRPMARIPSRSTICRSSVRPAQAAMSPAPTSGSSHPIDRADLWRLFAGPSRCAHRPGARRQRTARPRRPTSRSRTT